MFNVSRPGFCDVLLYKGYPDVYIYKVSIKENHGFIKKKMIQKHAASKWPFNPWSLTTTRGLGVGENGD